MLIGFKPITNAVIFRNTLMQFMIIYALGSAHVKVPRMNRSRSFAVLFDKLSRKIGKVDPNKNLSILIDSYVELHMFLMPILGSAHVKFNV